MNPEVEPQSNLEMIHQSLREAHQFLSSLEAQNKAGLNAAQPASAIDTVSAEDQSAILRDDASRPDER